MSDDRRGYRDRDTGPAAERRALPADIVRAREQAHGRVLWIVNAVDAYQAGRITVRQRDGYQTFRWKHGARWWRATSGHVALDLGDVVIKVRNAYFDHPPVAGWGIVTDKKTAEARLADRCGRDLRRAA